MASHFAESYFLSHGHLFRFTKSLHQAVYDRRLEKQTEVRYYYDADVVIWLLLGFQYLDVYPRKQKPSFLLVRSLLSTGYLGTAYILRPHALELESVLQRQPSFKGISAESGFLERVNRFLKEKGIEKEMERLLQIVHSDESEDDRISKFLENLAEVSPDSFVWLELAHGEWRERLKRVYRRSLRFENDFSDIPSLLRDKKVWEFKRTISKQRHRRAVTMSNLQDAAALGILHRFILRRETDDSTPLVRFYTDTPGLRSAWASSREMKNDLSYVVPGNEKKAGRFDEGFIFRDTDYFILRASFGELHFPGVSRRRKSGDAIHLEELERVAHELGEALDERQPLASKIERMKIGDRPLREVLSDIESLSFLQSVWSDYEPPKAMKKLVTGLADVWAFADNTATRRRLKREIREEVEGLQQGLSSQAASLWRWYDDFRRIQTRSRSLKEDLEEDEVPEPMRDLGLVRWGLALDPGGKEKLVGYVNGLLARDEETWSEGCAAVASARNDVFDRESCSVVASIFWLLTLFKQVIEIINDYDNISSEELPPGLVLMRTAARLRAGGTFSRAEKERHLVALTNVVGTLEGVEKGRFLLGLGYVIYYTWFSEKENVAIGSGDIMAAEFAQTWGQATFDCGAKAARLLEGDRLGRAFAINHCAYVGTMTDITDQNQVEKFIELLIEIKSESEVWHYRFADTLSQISYSHAKRLYESSLALSSGTKRRTMRKKAIELLASAGRRLADARPHFGDPEIPTHRLQIEGLNRRLGEV